MKRLATLLFATLFCLFALPGAALAAEPFRVVNPPLPPMKGKVEVIEFFSYGCPHCSDFHPLVSKWAANLPKDVSFRRVPISFGRPEWARLSKLYYALEMTGDLAKLDTAVFMAIHEQRVMFKTDEAVISWAASKGADGKKFGEAMTSFSMQSKVQRADQDAAAAQVNSVPSLLVDGKYMVNNEAASNLEELLKLADGVIAKARKERAGK